MTTSLNLSEPLVDAAIAKLSAGIAARIATINAADTKGVTIAAPANIFPFGLPGPLAAAPCYVVTPFGESPSYEKEGSHGFIYAETLAVMVVEEDMDRERVGRKLLRHRRAVIETLWDDAPREALTNSAFTIEPVRHVVGPTFDPNQDTSMWRSFFLQIFIARQQEGD